MDVVEGVVGVEQWHVVEERVEWPLLSMTMSVVLPPIPIDSVVDVVVKVVVKVVVVARMVMIG